VGPFRRLADAGVPLCLGSDQHVRSDLLGEARALEAHARLVSGERGRFSPAELVDALTVTGPPPAADSSSSTRAGDLLRTTTLRPGTSFDGPVLLVDDRIRSRWTTTVAAALLAEAGATSVLPLALHQLP